MKILHLVLDILIICIEAYGLTFLIKMGYDKYEIYNNQRKLLKAANYIIDIDAQIKACDKSIDNLHRIRQDERTLELIYELEEIKHKLICYRDRYKNY